MLHESESNQSIFHEDIELKKNKLNTITIILTCTVNVNLNKSCVYQKNKDERIQVYLKKIHLWLDKTNFNIIVVENSGYLFDELKIEQNIHNNRFEIITFDEKPLPEAMYLKNNDSKGASEVFSILYAFNNSRLIHNSIFIIKITGRYFIPELEEYLKLHDLNKYDCLTQHDKDRCEMVGSHYNIFTHMFDTNLLDMNKYNGHIESVWKYRASNCKNVLTCKLFEIEKTQQGGINNIYVNI